MRTKWSAGKLLATLSVTEEMREASEWLWKDMESEYDAEILCRELSRRKENGQQFSEEFGVFEALWRAEERNHYHAFRILCAAITGLTEDEIDAEMAERKGNFEAFGHLLDNEADVCLLIAFDEFCTLHAYTLDEPFYIANGLRQLVMNLKIDESRHLKGAIALLKQHGVSDPHRKLTTALSAAGVGGYGNSFLFSDLTNSLFSAEKFEELSGKFINLYGL